MNDDVTISNKGFADPIPQVEKVEGLNSANFPVQFGRYKLKGLLGQGGMARVFLAELQGPAGFRKPVALKVIQPKKGKKASTKETFDLIREACLAGRLKHPNLVDVYELGEANEQLFISMELVEGPTLHKLIQSTSRIPPAVIFEIALGIARGLKKAHGRISKERPFGLVHCDLKPSNILISMEGEVKIGDFGIAIQRDFGADLGFELPGLVQGTPSYMSPEQFQAMPLDGRSDLFATGLLIVEMVLGKKPFPKHFVMKTLLAGKALRAPLLTRNQFDQIEQITPGLGDVVVRCLAPDREKRFHNAEALVNALRGMQAQVGYEPRLHMWLLEAKQPATGSPKSTKNRPAKKVDSAQKSSLFNEATQAVASAQNLSNIEPSLDRFVGRETELTTLNNYFREGAHLVTLKGFGGAGKTRFSRRFARTMMFEWKGGAWFVDLTERTTVLGVAHAIATVLDIPLSGQGDERQLMDHLGARIAAIGPVLIVLDNFEQVIDHAPATVGRLLTLAPEGVFLVTSRESLKLPAEHIFQLDPLPVKDSVELFKLRAETAGGRWPNTKKTDAVIQRITKRLDGLPLAIELAAARARMMSPEQILDRLSQRFKLLAGARRGAIPRQATLRALIDWSWDLLEPWEKSGLAQVSVFREGFSMEAAEAVLDLSAWPDAPWSLDVVGSLLDKSLLRSRQVSGQPRFEMYVSIQEYAAEKLNGVEDANRPDAAQHTQHRHAAWFANLGKHRSGRLPEPKSHSHRSIELIDELDNLIAGAGYGNSETAALCSILAIRVLMLTGPVSLGADLASETLRQPNLPRHLRMQLETSRSRCLRLAGSMAEARAMVSDPMAQKNRAIGETEPDSTSESIGDRERTLLEAERLVELGNIEKAESRYLEAENCFLSAIEIFQKHGNRAGEGDAYGSLGGVYQNKGELDRAIAHYTQAIDIAREIGDKRTEGSHLGNLGDIFVKMEQLSDAEKAFRKAIPILDETFFIAAGAFRGSLALLLAQTDQFDEAQALLEVGEPQVATYPSEYAKFLCKKSQVQLLAGEPEAAQSFLDQAKAIASEYKFGDDGEVPEAIRETSALLSSPDNADEPSDESRAFALLEAERLMELGHIERAESKYIAAERCFLSALEIFQEHGDRAGEGAALGQRGVIYERKGELTQSIDHFTQALDIAREIGDKNIEGSTLCNLGMVYDQIGDLDQSIAHYTQSLIIAREIGNRPGEGVTLGNLGTIHRRKGELERAGELYNQALDIAREVGLRSTVSLQLGNLGNVYKAQGHHRLAIKLHTQAINIAREIGDKRGEGINLGNLGGILFQENRFEEAQDAYKKAIAISDVACPPAAGAFRASLALVLAHKGQHDEARSLLEAGEPLLTSTPGEYTKFFVKKGQIQLLADEPEAAQKSLDQAKALATEYKLENDVDVAQAISDLEGLISHST